MIKQVFKLNFAILVLGLTITVAAFAQNEFPTPTQGKTVVGIQTMFLNGSGQAIAVSPDTPVPVSGAIAGASYSAGVASYTGYASATDIVSITGSATKTINVIGIRISGYATANDNIGVALVKRSTANTGGTPTGATETAWDSLNPAATATVVSYGSAPTLGTLVGSVCACQLRLPAVSGAGGDVLEWQFNRNGIGPIVLRGIGEVLAINAYGVSLPAGTNLNVTIEWVEQ